MFDHISLGVRDIAASGRFYDAALRPLGCKRLSSGETSLGYGRDAVGLWLGATAHPVPADERSGLHFCFAAPDRKSVDAFHAAALNAGGTSDGAPGLRAHYDARYYAAFIRDPDGNRIEAVTFLQGS